MTCQINEPDYLIVDLDHLVNAGGLDILRKLPHFVSIILKNEKLTKREKLVRLWVRVGLKKKI